MFISLAEFTEIAEIFFFPLTPLVKRDRYPGKRKKLKGSAPVKYDTAFNGVKVQGLGKAVETAPPSGLQ